jgi:hypothetical protein
MNIKSVCTFAKTLSLGKSFREDFLPFSALLDFPALSSIRNSGYEVVGGDEFINYFVMILLTNSPIVISLLLNRKDNKLCKVAKVTDFPKSDILSVCVAS